MNGVAFRLFFRRLPFFFQILNTAEQIGIWLIFIPCIYSAQHQVHSQIEFSKVVLSTDALADNKLMLLEHNPDYRLLDRLRADCEYFLGAGNRAEKHLWAGSVYAQIVKMRELYDALPQKPEWLTKEAIDDYADRMAPQYQVVVYHHFENGFDEKLDYQTLEEAHPK